MASLQELAEELGEEGQEEEDGSGAEPFDEDDRVIRLDDMKSFMTGRGRGGLVYD